MPLSGFQAQLLYLHECQVIHHQQEIFMDIYQIAATWDSPQNGGGDPSPAENPPFDPRPEVPVPNVPEETPPYEKEPETPPMQPEPELPPVEPVIPESEPLMPGTQPEIPAYN